MKCIIETPNFKARQELLDFVEEKVSKLDRLTDIIIESKVFLKLDNTDNKENKICEIQLVIPGNDLFAKNRSSGFEDAVMKTIEGIKHQLQRLKDAEQKRIRKAAKPVDTAEEST